MKRIEARILLIGFALALGLLFAAAPAHAQAPRLAPAPLRTQVAPPMVTNTYAAKFICGVQTDSNIYSIPDAHAGRYATKINVHNNTGIDIRFRKKVIQLKGGQVPFEPTFKKIEGLGPDWAMEVVCRDIYSHLNITPVPNVPPPYIEGFVIFEVIFQQPLPSSVPRDPLDVEGIYTYFGPPYTQGVSIDVVVYPAKSNQHPMTP